MQRRALTYCVEDLGDLTLAELTPQRQQVFVERMKERGHGEPYVKRTLGALRAALGRAYKRGEVISVPYVITGDLADSKPRQRVLEIDELAALWRAVKSNSLARWLDAAPRHRCPSWSPGEAHSGAGRRPPAQDRPAAA